MAKNVRPPRTLILPHPRGATLGEPNNREMQTRVLRKALSLFETVNEGGAMETLETGWPDEQ